ncbi:SsrA-binding protein SmpB [Lentisphaerota bacterium WC36G]|nr:SsrA-binding protein SmpB [Lentisphaerae bacterium WC36]
MIAKKKNAKDNSNVLVTNRKAFHDYTILEKIEAGLELRGTEVKSCRDRTISLADSYVHIKDGQAWLLNVHIAGYDHGNRFNHDSRRMRRLLLHKKEILKLSQQIREKGLTIIPLKFYLKHGRVKVEVGVAKGKNLVDKRETLKRKQDSMDAKRAIAQFKG